MSVLYMPSAAGCLSLLLARLRLHRLARNSSHLGSDVYSTYDPIMNRLIAYHRLHRDARMLGTHQGGASAVQLMPLRGSAISRSALLQGDGHLRSVPIG